MSSTGNFPQSGGASAARGGEGQNQQGTPAEGPGQHDLSGPYQQPADGPAAYAQASYGQNPYGEAPSGQNPYGQNPYGQAGAYPQATGPAGGYPQ